MKIYLIATNGLRRLFRDRSNIFFVFVLPMVIILVIGLVFGTGFTTRLALIAEDPGPVESELAARIGSIPDLIVLRATDIEEVRQQMRRNEIDALVVIPAGYGAAVLAGQSVELGYLATPSVSGPEVRTLVQAEVSQHAAELRAARFAAQHTGIDTQAALATAKTVNAALPSVDAVREGSASSFSAFDLGASQQLVLFMFITALASSTALIQSRRLGVSRRMLSTPTSAGTVVVGETAGRYLVILMQGLFIVLGAALLFGVGWGDPLAATLVVLGFGLCGTGSGMLVGSMFGNEQQAGGLSIFLALVLGALGGSMVPLEVFPETVRRIAHLTPHAWANDAFAELLRFGSGAPEIALELVVLFTYGSVLVLMAAFVFRHRLTH